MRYSSRHPLLLVLFCLAFTLTGCGRTAKIISQTDFEYPQFRLPLQVAYEIDPTLPGYVHHAAKNYIIERSGSWEMDKSLEEDAAKLVESGEEVERKYEFPIGDPLVESLEAAMAYSFLKAQRVEDLGPSSDVDAYIKFSIDPERTFRVQVVKGTTWVVVAEPQHYEVAKMFIDLDVEVLDANRRPVWSGTLRGRGVSGGSKGSLITQASNDAVAELVERLRATLMTEPAIVALARWKQAEHRAVLSDQPTQLDVGSSPHATPFVETPVLGVVEALALGEAQKMSVDGVFGRARFGGDNEFGDYGVLLTPLQRVAVYAVDQGRNALRANATTALEMAARDEIEVFWVQHTDDQVPPEHVELYLRQDGEKVSPTRPVAPRFGVPLAHWPKSPAYQRVWYAAFPAIEIDTARAVDVILLENGREQQHTVRMGSGR